VTVTVRVPSLRSLALVFGGAVLGAALVAPVVAGDRSEAAAVVPSAIQTRYASCAGLHWYPVNSATEYESLGTARVSAGGAMFFCDPDLPHRAVVTAVRFSVSDPSTVSQVQNCALGRHPLTVEGMGDIEVMASVPPTGGPEQPLAVRLVDRTIDFATVNNNKYAYWLQCEATAGSQLILGASVQYAIDTADG
jgi:hypothetical protein